MARSGALRRQQRVSLGQSGARLARIAIGSSASFHQNKRFDRFTIEQVAGDLLPDATQETRVASAYNRLILSTEEGGAQPKQYEAKYLTDRVKSIGTTWLAQTFMCSECHDHKFDPVTARDFYSLGAFFADVEEPAVGSRGKGGLLADEAQLAKLKELDEKLAPLEEPRRQGSGASRGAESAR